VGNEYTEELISKRIIHAGFEKIKDFRADNQSISMLDALMSAFAMFSLKDPSLLAFDERRNSDENLKRLYKIKTIPCDTQMRTLLDEVDPEEIRPLFKDVFGSSSGARCWRSWCLWQAATCLL
jgi:hypothetical protein